METLEQLYAVRVSHDTIRSISVSPDERHVAFGCRDNSIKIYDLEDFTLIKTLHGHTMPVFAVQYAPDGTYLVSGSRDAQLKIWDNLSFEQIQNIPAHLFAVPDPILQLQAWIKASKFGEQTILNYTRLSVVKKVLLVINFLSINWPGMAISLFP